MRLHFCASCGQSIRDGASTTAPVDAAAAAALEADRAQCEHMPTCAGPWAHAVKLCREAYDLGKAQAATARTRTSR